MIQLSRLVSFHKALSDPNRIRMVALLKDGPLHGQALASKLHLKPPTVTHHAKKLKDAGIIVERRNKNTIYFHLNEKSLALLAHGILELGGDQMSNQIQVKDEEKLAIIKNFTTVDGKLKQIPAQQKKKIIILAYYIRGLEHGKKYQEKEINEYIQQFHEDFATIRREWVMHHFIYRQNNMYELNPKEMWPLVF